MAPIVFHTLRVECRRMVSNADHFTVWFPVAVPSHIKHLTVLCRLSGKEAAEAVQVFTESGELAFIPSVVEQT